MNATTAEHPHGLYATVDGRDIALVDLAQHLEEQGLDRRAAQAQAAGIVLTARAEQCRLAARAAVWHGDEHHTRTERAAAKILTSAAKRIMACGADLERADELIARGFQAIVRVVPEEHLTKYAISDALIALDGISPLFDVDYPALD